MCPGEVTGFTGCLSDIMPIFLAIMLAMRVGFSAVLLTGAMIYILGFLAVPLSNLHALKALGLKNSIP